MSSYIGYLEQTRVTGEDGYVGTINLTGKSIAGGCKAAMQAMEEKANEVSKQGPGLSIDEIRQQLEQARDKTKEEIGAHIDQSTDEMVKHISNLPADQQKGAMRAWMCALGIVQAAVAKAMDFIRKAISAVLDWVQDMWTKVKSWISRAMEIFSNIFC